jgi:hypothetical protein
MINHYNKRGFTVPAPGGESTEIHEVELAVGIASRFWRNRFAESVRSRPCLRVARHTHAESEPDTVVVQTTPRFSLPCAGKHNRS